MKNLIIVVSIIAITATIGTIVVGARIFDGLVEDNPYEKGLAWDDLNRNRERLGWKMTLQPESLRIGSNELVITVIDRNGSPLEADDVNVYLSRPSTRAHDAVYQTARIGKGHFKLSAEFPLEGKWDIHAEVRKEQERCRLTRAIFVTRK